MSRELIADEFSFPTGQTFAPVGVAYVAEAGLPFGGAAPGGRIWRLPRDGGRQLLVDGLPPPVNAVIVHDSPLYDSKCGHPARISRLPLDGDRPPKPFLDHLPGRGNYHTNMVAFGRDGTLDFSQGAMTNGGILGLDAYELGWLPRLRHAHDLPGFDVVLAGVEAKAADPLRAQEGNRACTGSIAPFGTRAQARQRIGAAVPCTAAVMRCHPDWARLELAALGLRNDGFITGGRVVGALEPHLRVAGALLLPAYGPWLVLEPLEWPRGGLWVPAALSLDNLSAGVVLAGSAPAHAVAALLGVTSCTLAGLGFWAAELVHRRVPGYAARLAGVALLAIALLQAAGIG